MGKKESNKKRQHYVPQFYLKNFSSRKTVKAKKSFSTHFFDKPTERTGMINIKNIAQENYFYGSKNDQKLEDELSKIESRCSSIYGRIINNRDITILEFARNRSLMSLFLGVQFIRTKFFREAVSMHTAYIKNKLLDEFDYLGEELFSDFEEMLKEESKKKFHLDFLNYSSIADFAKLFLSKKWILLDNSTEIPFFTSDNPIVLFNPFNLGHFGNLGLLSQGIQIYFPLNNELCLCLLDPKSYRNYKKMMWIDSHYMNYNIFKTEKYDVELMDVCFQNNLQVKQSFRQIFSKTSDFSLAECMLKEDPLIKEKEIDNNLEVNILKGVNTPTGKKDIIHTKRNYY